MEIPFIDLQAQRSRLGDRIDAAVAGVLEHGRFILGPEVGRFECELAAFCGVDHVVSCGNGTDALELILRSWQVGPGDAVFLPSFTFTATAEAVSLVGATPIFVDVRGDTFNLDAGKLAAAVCRLGEGLRPAVIMPVDLFGQPADYQAIREVADAHGLRVLADGAQSLGGASGDRRVGSLADATATSFFPAKPLGCYGDGGAVLTDDGDLADALCSLRVHGKDAGKYDNVRIGRNSRLDTIQAAVLLEKLAILEDEIQARQLIAQRYTKHLDDVVEVPQVETGVTSAWAQYTIQIGNRDEVAMRLREAGVPTAVYYPRPLHNQPAYCDYPCPGSLEKSEQLSRRVLSLPFHPYLDEGTQDRIINAVRDSAG